MSKKWSPPEFGFDPKLRVAHDFWEIRKLQTNGQIVIVYATTLSWPWCYQVLAYSNGGWVVRHSRFFASAKRAFRFAEKIQERHERGIERRIARATKRGGVR